MRMGYSPDINALCVRPGSREVEQSVEIGDKIFADVDAAGEKHGIECFDAATCFSFLAQPTDRSEGLVIVDLLGSLASLVRDQATVTSA